MMSNRCPHKDMKTQPCVCYCEFVRKVKISESVRNVSLPVGEEEQTPLQPQKWRSFYFVSLTNTSSATSRGDPAEVKVTVRISAREPHKDGLIGHGWVHYVMVTSWLLQNRKHTSAHQTPAAAAFISLTTKPHKKEVFVSLQRSSKLKTKTAWKWEHAPTLESQAA